MAKAYRNVTLDSDINDKLNVICDRLEAELGFRPSLSQAVRYLIAKFEKEPPK